MKKTKAISYVLLLFFIKTLSVGQTYNSTDIPYYYNKLPNELINAPWVKIQKIKSLTIKTFKSKESNYFSFDLDGITYYDTNGIPLKFYQVDTTHYYKGYHLADDFLIDSVLYKINSFALLDEQISYFRTGYNEKHFFYYDSLKRCCKVIELLHDSIEFTEYYKYDSLNRMIEKINIEPNNIDTIGFRFIFENNRIKSIISFENQKEWEWYKYIFNNSENSLTEYETKHKKKNKIKKEFFDDKGNIKIIEEYLEKSIVKVYSDFDSLNNPILISIYEMNGNTIIGTRYIEKIYGPKNLIINEKVYYKNYNLDHETRYFYEFYQ